MQKMISKEDKFDMQHKEFDLRTKGEETKKNLDISILKEQLRLVTEKLTEVNERKVQYKEANNDRIHEYGYKQVTKSKAAKFGVLALDVIACIAGNQGLATTWIENVTYSLIQASLIFYAGKVLADKSSTPNPNPDDTQTASMTGLITVIVVILSGVIRYKMADADGWVFAAMHVGISLTVYLVTYLALKGNTPTKETVYYNGMVEELTKLETERLELYTMVVEREKQFEDFKLSNLTNRHETILDLDGEDERKAKIDLERQKAELEIQETKRKQEQEYQKEQERKEAEWQLTQNRKAEAERMAKEQEAALKGKYSVPDFMKKIGGNGVMMFLVALIPFFSACTSENVSLDVTESAVTVFVDPSPEGAAQHIAELIPDGKEVLEWMGNSMEVFTRNGGKYDLFIMGELYGMQHYQTNLEPLGVMAFMEQHKSKKHLQGFVDSVNIIGNRIRLPPDGYKQSRITANLFDALHYLKQQPYKTKVLVIISDLLEHTPSMSFLRKSALQLEKSEKQLFDYFNKYCQCSDLSGIEIIINYKAVSEEKYDEQRVIVKQIFKRFFESKGAIVKFY